MILCMNLVMNSGSQLSRMLYQNHLVPVLSLAGCYHLMQVRWVDQTQYPMIVVASLSAVPQSCRTPLPNQYLDCMLLAVYTHTHTRTHPPNFLVTQNFVTHYLSHNFAAQNFVTHKSFTHTHTQLCHTGSGGALGSGMPIGDIAGLGLVARLGPP